MPDYTKRKHELMYEMFGRTAGKTCRDCENCGLHEVGNRTVYKCEVYGVTWSAATDWAIGKEACGMFDKQWDGKPIVRLRMAKNDCRVVLDGQVSLFEGGGGE